VQKKVNEIIFLGDILFNYGDFSENGHSLVPAGYCADGNFCKGTVEILKAVSENKGFSLIGGGHLSDAIEISKINKKKFGHISLSGGALLRYISGEKLGGLELLDKIK